MDLPEGHASFYRIEVDQQGQVKIKKSTSEANTPAHLRSPSIGKQSSLPTTPQTSKEGLWIDRIYCHEDGCRLLLVTKCGKHLVIDLHLGAAKNITPMFAEQSASSAVWLDFPSDEQSLLIGCNDGKIYCSLISTLFRSTFLRRDTSLSVLTELSHSSITSMAVILHMMPTIIATSNGRLYSFQIAYQDMHLSAVNEGSHLYDVCDSGQKDTLYLCRGFYDLNLIDSPISSGDYARLAQRQNDLVLFWIHSRGVSLFKVESEDISLLYTKVWIGFEPFQRTESLMMMLSDVPVVDVLSVVILDRYIAILTESIVVIVSRFSLMVRKTLFLDTLPFGKVVTLLKVSKLIIVFTEGVYQLEIDDICICQELQITGNLAYHFLLHAAHPSSECARTVSSIVDAETLKITRCLVKDRRPAVLSILFRLLEHKSHLESIIFLLSSDIFLNYLDQYKNNNFSYLLFYFLFASHFLTKGRIGSLRNKVKNSSVTRRDSLEEIRVLAGNVKASTIQLVKLNPSFRVYDAVSWVLRNCGCFYEASYYNIYIKNVELVILETLIFSRNSDTLLGSYPKTNEDYIS